MPIISFSKKVLDEYVDTFTSDINELLEPQTFIPLKLLNLPKKVAVFKPLDLLDTEGYRDAKNKAMEMINTKPDVLVIDMQNVRHLNSMGLGLLITLLNLMKDINGKLILCSLSEQVKLHLKLAGVDKLLEIYDQYPNI